MSFFAGSPAEYEQVSSLTPEQMRGQRQLEGAAQAGKGGAFGQAGDYYRQILNNDPAAFNALFAPELRQFREQTIPGLAEQFAGMGAGGLSSSGFRNATQSAGTDLAERLASIRQQLRSGAAQGLMGLGQQSLQPHSQWMQTQEASPGMGGAFMQGLGSAIPGFLMGGPAGSGAGFLSGLFGSGGGGGGGNVPMGSSSPYGGYKPGIASPTSSGYKGTFGAVPNFAQGFV